MSAGGPMVSNPEAPFGSDEDEKQYHVYTDAAVEHSDGDPFGVEEFADVKYKTMEWWQAGLVMIAETVSLGILSLPSTLATLGIVPGEILIIGLGALATYTGYILGQFKLRYPHVYSMADAGEVLMGPIGREILGTAQLIFLIFTMGSSLLTFSNMLNTVSDHGACSIIFGLVGMIVSFIFTIPRTLKNVSWMSLASFISIVAAVIAAMIAIGVQNSAKTHVDATRNQPFYEAFLAVTNIVFAYCGHVSFFAFIAEMKAPEEFPKALYLLQICDTTMYAIVAVVIYRYAGVDVKSPALASAGPIMSKVAYGLAIPTIVISGVVNGHIAAKYVYVRMFRHTDQMHQRTWFSFGVWLALGLILWVIAWVIAEAIPVFNDLLSLVSALFASWFTYGMSGIFWLFLNWGQLFSSPRKIGLTIVNVITVGIGAALCGLGLYVSGKAIHDDSSQSSFSCAFSSS